MGRLAPGTDSNMAPAKESNHSRMKATVAERGDSPIAAGKPVVGVEKEPSGTNLILKMLAGP